MAQVSYGELLTGELGPHEFKLWGFYLNPAYYNAVIIFWARPKIISGTQANIKIDDDSPIHVRSIDSSGNIKHTVAVGVRNPILQNVGYILLYATILP